MVANLDLRSGARRSAPRSPDRAASWRQIGLWATIALAALTAVGMFVQVYLIAGVLFGEDWRDLHWDLGKFVHLGYLLTFGTALVALWPNLRAMLWPFVLAGLGSTQAFSPGSSISRLSPGGSISPGAMVPCTRSTGVSCPSCS
jgi:hypothetical protein